jgi:hypothetical protein
MTFLRCFDFAQHDKLALLFVILNAVKDLLIVFVVKIAKLHLPMHIGTVGIAKLRLYK